eukprot:214921-Prymnesium_polylepis.2
MRWTYRGQRKRTRALCVGPRVRPSPFHARRLPLVWELADGSANWTVNAAFGRDDGSYAHAAGAAACCAPRRFDGFVNPGFHVPSCLLTKHDVSGEQDIGRRYTRACTHMHSMCM